MTDLCKIDLMGQVGATKQTRYGKRRTNFEDLTGVVLPNGWRCVALKYAYSGASYWAFECSKGCGAGGVAASHAVKKRKGCGCQNVQSTDR